MNYLIASFRNFTTENLERLLAKDNRNMFFTIHSCREVVNRQLHLQDSYNFMAGVRNDGNSTMTLEEINANHSVVTSILQKMVNNFYSIPFSITCSNRFIYWQLDRRLKSPLGSLISGMLKIMTTYEVSGDTEEEFSKNFIDACTKDGTLGSISTISSVITCYYLFLNFTGFPPDPNTTSIYGTHDYLHRHRSSISSNILVPEEKKKYLNYLKEINIPSMYANLV